MAGFFRSNTSNIKACIVSIILLNYNCACTSYVLYLISRVDSVDTVAYAMCTVSLMFGLLVGQILFGVFGDTLGRKRSCLGSAITMFIGSVLSIFSGILHLTSGDKETVIEFSIFRFILGVGAGGLFPLVAAITRESSQEEIANATIAQVFGPFGTIGLVFAPFFVFLLTGVNVDDDWKWRIVLAIGAVPAALLIFMDVEETMALERTNSIQPEQSSSAGCAKLPVSLELFLNELSVVFSSPSMRSYLVSTSLSWFFSDILHCTSMVLISPPPPPPPSLFLTLSLIITAPPPTPLHQTGTSSCRPSFSTNSSTETNTTTTTTFLSAPWRSWASPLQLVFGSAA